MKRIIAIAVIFAGVFVPSVYADRYAVDVPASGLSTFSPDSAGLGSYYVLQFDPPAGVTSRTLRHAFLEFFLDASAREVDSYTDNSPVLEVYALKSTFTGQLDPSQFMAQALPAVRNVAVGDERRVVVDITEIVRVYLEDSAENHGLIVGSLTGIRPGVFSIRTDKIGGSAVARVVLFD